MDTCFHFSIIVLVLLHDFRMKWLFEMHKLCRGVLFSDNSIIILKYTFVWIIDV